MKKFLFIIPILKKYSSYVKILLTLIFLVVGIKKTKAQVEGCRVLAGSTYRVYYTEMVPPGDKTMWRGLLISGAGGYDNQGTSDCFVGTGTICKVYRGDGMGGVKMPLEELYTGEHGKLYTNCPIDDYIPALFIFTTVIFFYRNKKLRPVNESKPNHRSL